MVDNPISNPGVTPTPSTPSFGRDQPRLGEGEEAEAQKPFSLAPEGGKAGPAQAESTAPSPMSVMGDAARSQTTISPEQLQDQLSNLKERFSNIQTQLSDTKLTNQFTPDHLSALNTITDKLNPDMRTIAKTTQGEFNPPQTMSGSKVLNSVTNWLNGSQGTLTHALDYLQTTQKPNIGDYIRLQYAVQRATQKGELFASIVGASVSGIKTIMSTQLG